MSVTAVPLRPVKKGSVLKLWIALGALLLIAAGVAWYGTAAHIFQTTPSGLQFRAIKEGVGPHPTATDVTLIQYTGRLPDGTVFDTNMNGQPLPMPAADGAAIKGFTEGLRMMRKGGTYRLRIPPQLGYGAAGQPPAIPPNSTLEFDVKLLEFMPESVVRALQQQMIQQQMQGAQPGGQGAPGAVPGGQAPPHELPTR
jgi:FKBP-type peptidyl-prolyl cis-trans isomerase FkpA